MEAITPGRQMVACMEAIIPLELLDRLNEACMEATTSLDRYKRACREAISPLGITGHVGKL